MPALNFGTSDYITLGYLVSASDMERDDEDYLAEVRERVEEDYADELEEFREDGDESDVIDFIDDKISEYISNDIDYMYEDAFREVEYMIDALKLRYITVEAKSGYYEGAWLDITMDFDYMESEDDREDLYDDIGQLGEFLNTLVEYGWREVSCSYYGGSHRAGYDETCVAVAEAIKRMMEEASNAEVEDRDEPGSDW